MYINIHSPGSGKKDEWAIQNLHKDFDTVNGQGLYATGLHPWFLHEDSLEKELDQLKMASKNKHVVAIGETGLDKACNTNMELQQKAFSEQIIWANEIGKPMIIHCVRAYEEVLQMLLTHKNKMPVIFHGYDKNWQIAEKIIAHGYYISIGKAVLKPKNKAVFSRLPIHRIFIETHDPDISIESIYQEVAMIRGISLQAFTLQVEQNAARIFKQMK